MSLSFKLIADNSRRFSTFAPYVASINDDGVVAFQARLTTGATGVFAGDGGAITVLMKPGNTQYCHIYSHPDISAEGAVCAYSRLSSGGQGIVLARGGGWNTVADTSRGFQVIGPLGPTMNASGVIAFRAQTDAKVVGIFVTDRQVISSVASSDEFAGFEGLPVVTDAGTVVFRANRVDGTHGIYRWSRPSIATVVDDGGRFRDLGRFPAANNAGAVAFTAGLRSGGAGVFIANGQITTIADSGDGFDSFRGALINDAGTVVFYATPTGGQLGIYAAQAAKLNKILAIGDSFGGRTIKSFALNPVSMNNSGQLAIRIQLDDEHEAIIRIDPND